MGKFFKAMILGLALVVGLGLSTPSAFAGIQLNHFVIQVYEEIGWMSGPAGTPELRDDVQYVVFVAGSTTKETIYSDAAGTAMANPVMEDVYDNTGRMDFYTATASTTVDIIVTDNTTGSSAFLNTVTTSVHKVVINNRPFEKLICAIYYSTSTDANNDSYWLESKSEYDTQVDFPKNSIIYDAFIYVHTSAGNDCDMNIGIAEDKDSLLAGIQLDYVAAGWNRVEPLHDAVPAIASIRFGAYGDDLTAESSTDVAGTDAANTVWLTSSAHLLQVLKPKLITVASTLHYNITSTHPLGTGVIFVVFEMLIP